jgi:hypothetical protein
MKLNVSWTDLKSFTTSRGLSIQWVIYNNMYALVASSIDNQVKLLCQLPMDGNDDQVDFETNFKPNGNKSCPILIQPFASKTLPNGKSLFKRFTGTSFSLVPGGNTFTWTQSSFPLVKFLGIEVINGEIGDTCSLFVLDTTTGTYSGYPNAPLNQFAFNANVAPSFYKHTSEYDSDMYQNLQIKFVYNSVSSKTIYINFDMNEVK